MAKSNNQKAKILYLEKMLQNTNEEAIITMQEIISSLAENGISAERKSIYDDMEVLRNFGMDIRYRREKPSGYFWAKEESKEVLPKQSIENISEKNFMFGENKIQQEYKKPLRLLCNNIKRREVETYFGSEAIYKDKDEETFTVITAPVEGSGFYGWLTAMGKDVKIVKPKKMAAAYKEYLKSVLKNYKGI